MYMEPIPRTGAPLYKCKIISANLTKLKIENIIAKKNRTSGNTSTGAKIQPWTLFIRNIGHELMRSV